MHTVSFRGFPKESLMHGLMKKVERFLVSEDGPTAVEYAVMLALILVACITIVKNLGTSISGTFSTVSSSLGASS
jgi:pilus assembly protein Flp/PilA